MASSVAADHQIWRRPDFNGTVTVSEGVSTVNLGAHLEATSLNATDIAALSIIVFGAAAYPAVDVIGRVRTHSLEITGASDLAEPFNISGVVEPVPAAERLSTDAYLANSAFFTCSRASSYRLECISTAAPTPRQSVTESSTVCSASSAALRKGVMYLGTLGGSSKD